MLGALGKNKLEIHIYVCFPQITYDLHQNIFEKDESLPKGLEMSFSNKNNRVGASVT